MSNKSKTNAVTKRQHARKRELYLDYSAEKLTQKDIEDTVKLCLENPTNITAATIALIVLVTGSDFHSLIKRFNTSSGDLLFEVKNSPPSFPSGPHLEANCERAFIAAPPELKGLFALCLVESPSDKEINQFLSDGLGPRREGVTIKRLQRHLAFEASKYNISRAELAFISDTCIDRIPLNHYIRFDLAEINRKHQLYQHTLFAKTQKEQISVTTYSPQGMFGSNRVLTTKAVKDICVWYANQLPSQFVTLNNLKQAYNVYTSYVITYLSLETAHRPNKDAFSGLDNFDLISPSVVIRDKGGSSSRTMPLSEAAVKIIKNYLEFLKWLLLPLRLLENETFHQITRMINGEEPFFARLGARKLQAYSSSEDILLSRYNLKISNNWHRHYSIHYLGIRDISFDDIQLFAGHDSASITQHDIASGFSHKRVKELSDILSSHISNELQMPVSLHGLCNLRNV